MCLTMRCSIFTAGVIQFTKSDVFLEESEGYYYAKLERVNGSENAVTATVDLVPVTATYEKDYPQNLLNIKYSQ